MVPQVAKEKSLGFPRSLIRIGVKIVRLKGGLSVNKSKCYTFLESEAISSAGGCHQYKKNFN